MHPSDLQGSPCRPGRTPVRWRWPLRVAVLSALLAAGPALAQDVRCHLSYAGAQRSLTIPASRHTDEVPPQIQGASLDFQVLNRLPPEPGAGVQVRTFAHLNGTPWLLHQATYLGLGGTGPHGFTGLQVVREPVRANELVYWCERVAER